MTNQLSRKLGPDAANILGQQKTVTNPQLRDHMKEGVLSGIFFEEGRVLGPRAPQIERLVADGQLVMSLRPFR